jgi:hypothetical protein
VRARAGEEPDVFVAGVGTGGTITGVGRRLRELRRDVLIVSVIPELFPGIEGLKPLGAPDDIVPAILDQSLIDTRIKVTIEQALAMCKRLARSGHFLGLVQRLRTPPEIAATSRYRTIAAMLSDTGERCGSTGMWAQGDRLFSCIFLKNKSANYYQFCDTRSVHLIPLFTVNSSSTRFIIPIYRDQFVVGYAAIRRWSIFEQTGLFCQMIGWSGRLSVPRFETDDPPNFGWRLVASCGSRQAVRITSCVRQRYGA